MSARPSPAPAPSAGQSALLRAEALRVFRGDKEVLRRVTLEARAGEVLGVLGPSGAGKSTLFRTLAGEILPESGSVLLCGALVNEWPLWRRAREGLGYVPQEPSVLWDLSVRDNLVAFRQIAGAATQPDDVERAARRVDLEARLDVRAGELSAGERRRLELARAITRSPRVLVCDEPFAGVDPIGAARVGELLRDLASAGVAVLLADHHVAEALRICTRAVLLLDGEVAAEGEPGAFREHPLVQGRYLGNWTRTMPPHSHS